MLELPDPSGFDDLDDDGPGSIFLQEQRIAFSLGEDGLPVVTTSELRQGHVRGERGQWLRELATVYDQSFTEVVDIGVRIRFPDGETKTFGRDEAKDVPAIPGFVLYTDNRALLLAPPSVPAGSVVETRSVTRTKQPELFAFGHVFGSTVPARMSRLIVEVPDGWEIETVGELMDESVAMPPSATEREPGITRTTWERADLPGRTDIARGLGASSQHPAILLRLKAWTDGQGVAHKAPADAAELSRFEHALSKDKSARSPALEKTVADALKGVEDTPRAKARRLYAWTRDNVRYCAVSVGMGGWVPHAAPQTHELRYGDCKDKANLLKTMLTIAGVESRTATIYSSDWPRRFRLPVLASNFNHMILVVDLPEGPVVVDPTSRTTPFGDLPQVDEDRVMLPLSETGGALMDAPASSVERDVLDERYDLVLDDDGKATGTFTATLSGELSDDLRGQLLFAPKDRHDDVVEDMLGLLGPKVDSFTIANAAPPEEVTPVVLEGKLHKRLVRGGVGKGDVLVRASRLFGSAFPSVDEEARDGPRVGPFLLGHRRTLKATVRLKLPASLKVARVPEETKLDGNIGTYLAKWSTEDDERTLVLERTVVWKERVVPADGVDALRAFIATALAAEEEPVALVLAEGP